MPVKAVKPTKAAKREPLALLRFKAYSINLEIWSGSNYKTALKLCRKCRVLMTLSNSKKILDSMYYEADTIYIGARTEEKPRNGH